MMNKYIWWSFSLLILMISCSQSGEMYMVPVDNSWRKDDMKTLSFEVSDASNPKNITFVVRNNNKYPYNNLFLISTIKGNEGKFVKIDTLQYLLAKPNGEWLGTGMGKVKEIVLLYKSDFRFPEDGKYSIEIKQGMRRDILQGIEDIGVQIENVNTTQN